MVGIASRVQDLQQDLAALVVHGIGDATVPARFGRRHHLRGERQQPAGAVRRVTAGDDQADAAAGPLGEIRGEPVGVARAVLQAGVHRAHHHPVAQRGEAQGPTATTGSGTHSVTDSPSTRRHLVEPVDGALLGSNTAPQNQVLVQRAAGEGARVGELPLLESAVGVEQLGPFGAQGDDLVAQCGDVAVDRRRGSLTARSRVRLSVTELPRPVSGSAIQRASSARPASATVYTFLSGLPCCTTGVTCTQPSSSIVRSVR